MASRRPTTIDPVLHVHGQSGPHDDVVIEGTPVALLRLAAALRQATTGTAAKVDLFTNEGDGYTVRVVALASDEETRQAATPYTDEAFAYHGSDDPWRRAWERTEQAPGEQDAQEPGAGEP